VRVDGHDAAPDAVKAPAASSPDGDQRGPPAMRTGSGVITWPAPDQITTRYHGG
jgi:hypothetical protein